jgi:hypothetical protein
VVLIFIATVTAFETNYSKTIKFTTSNFIMIYINKFTAPAGEQAE